jgi:hypothetical protein
MGSLREDIIEEIECALVDLRPIAQPRDMAELNELLLDARDTEDPEQLERIAAQLEGLRRFCEARRRSSMRSPTVCLSCEPPPDTKRSR